ncbi:hypothetical protein CALCODRAFT_10792 [Calocera cornea HHB12733]|uniref:Uncharacterized protein n=1 Tax=Calocera cornea HHB12733 TaxID=1353952 RepID=A0A165J6U7_9BASI|nr:hypothetical protein CALCODRAFT_10792 [Calocera cornea HHB12733]
MEPRAPLGCLVGAASPPSARYQQPHSLLQSHHSPARLARSRTLSIQKSKVLERRLWRFSFSGYTWWEWLWRSTAIYTPSRPKNGRLTPALSPHLKRGLPSPSFAPPPPRMDPHLLHRGRRICGLSAGQYAARQVLAVSVWCVQDGPELAAGKEQVEERDDPCHSPSVHSRPTQLQVVDHLVPSSGVGGVCGGLLISSVLVHRPSACAWHICLGHLGSHYRPSYYQH